MSRPFRDTPSREATGSMFDVDAGKLLIIAVVALVVIGPKELPRVMRQVGQALARMRRMAGEFQSQFNEAMREADLADLRKDVASLNEQAKLDIDFNPMADMHRQITGTLDAPVTPTIAPPHVAAPNPVAAEHVAPSPAPEAPAPEPQPATLAGAGIGPVVPEVAVEPAREAHAGS